MNTCQVAPTAVQHDRDLQLVQNCTGTFCSLVCVERSQCYSGSCCQCTSWYGPATMSRNEIFADRHRFRGPWHRKVCEPVPLWIIHTLPHTPLLTYSRAYLVQCVQYLKIRCITFACLGDVVGQQITQFPTWMSKELGKHMQLRVPYNFHHRR
jgi:hypothetical protein